MALKVYDKAKWHWGAESAPKDIAEENGATHIAFFFRWCIEEGFSGREMLAEHEAEIGSIQRGDGSVDCRAFFLSACDGVLTSEELNPRGRKFADAYYSSEKTKFAKQYGYYLDDYGRFVEEIFGDANFDNTYFYVEYSDENFGKVKTFIDKRYAEFLDLTQKRGRPEIFAEKGATPQE